MPDVLQVEDDGKTWFVVHESGNLQAWVSCDPDDVSEVRQ